MPDDRLDQFRQRKDDLFTDTDHSPLTPEQRAAFTGLAYFPASPDLAFAVPIETSGPGINDHLEVKTTDGQSTWFLRAGRVTVEIDGQPVTLSLLKDLDRGRYFLPFRDQTAGTETYAVGRYLDPRPRPDGLLTVDFNYAYNPYCAYGEGWSCPIPPDENIVDVRIEAGERAFTDGAHDHND